MYEETETRRVTCPRTSGWCVAKDDFELGSVWCCSVCCNHSTVLLGLETWIGHVPLEKLLTLLCFGFLIYKMGGGGVIMMNACEEFHTL